MKRILLICTGGTIASTRTIDGFAPGIGAGEILSYIPEVTEKYRIDAVQVCNIDSTDMTPAYWTLIVRTIRSHYDSYDGFVVCHGTDTMAYTAAALSYMVRDSQKPIVVTGSQRPLGQEISDAKSNLLDSILYAADPSSSGVCIVFGGSVIAGTRAKKVRARSYDAFTSVNFPVLATIADGRILRYIESPKDMPDRPVFQETVSDSVAVFKLIPGSKPDMLDYLFEHYDCLVVESFGVGGIPAQLRDAFYSQMNRWIRSGKVIVIATQVMQEGSNMEVYAVGQKVKKDFDLMEAYDMTLEATVTKIMYLKERFHDDYEAIRRGFYEEVNYDILYTRK